MFRRVFDAQTVFDAQFPLFDVGSSLRWDRCGPCAWEILDWTGCSSRSRLQLARYVRVRVYVWISRRARLAASARRRQRATGTLTGPGPASLVPATVCQRPSLSPHRLRRRPPPSPHPSLRPPPSSFASEGHHPAFLRGVDISHLHSLWRSVVRQAPSPGHQRGLLNLQDNCPVRPRLPTLSHLLYFAAGPPRSSALSLSLSFEGRTSYTTPPSLHAHQHPPRSLSNHTLCTATDTSTIHPPLLPVLDTTSLYSNHASFASGPLV